MQKKLRLLPVNRQGKGNQYCGPSAISAITGCTTDEAARVIRHVSGKASVKGTSEWEVRSALGQFGIRVSLLKRWPLRERPTLASWIKDSVSQRTEGRVFLLVAGRHWQLVSGRRYVCGRVKEVVSLNHEKVKRRARVEALFELTVSSTGLHKPEVAAEPKRKKPDADAAKARQLAAQHGIGIDLVDGRRGDHFEAWVYPPEGRYEDGEDPHEGNRFCTSWDEVLEKVETYAGEKEAH